MWRATLTLDSTATLSLLRICIAFMVFLLSSDIVGAFLGYIGAVGVLDAILNRLEAAELAGFPEPDILLLMADYNAAVEASPVVLPIVYRFKSKRLAKAWHSYAAAHTFWDDQASQIATSADRPSADDSLRTQAP